MFPAFFMHAAPTRDIIEAMRVFIIFAISVFVLGSISTTAIAQSREPLSSNTEVIQKFAYRYDPLFDSMVRDVLSARNLGMSFSEFRRNYALTSQYAPIADTITDEMLKRAFEAQNAATPEAAKKAYDAFNVLVMDHMANLQVVLQALALARTDKRFGDTKTLEWVRTGLLKNLMVSGDGKTLRDAYDIISLEEEIILLQSLGIKPTQTLSNREGIIYYNMHDYIDTKTGRPSTLFVNSSYPMRFLEAKSKIKSGPRLNTLRQ